MDEFEEREDRILKIDIEQEMKTAYIDYSMSVIVSRALPDVRDGLKPVHRRVLYAMNDMGNVFNQPTRKSAKPVGEVLANYHPHGDSSVYDALVRLAQPWNIRYPLVDGQGNFGSIDGDSPAAMRYTEARMTEIAGELLRDIDKETVTFQSNFDDTRLEPTVLPTRFPNLLVNGASGIAVGMATNMAPHNLGESIDACVAFIDAKGDITIDELMSHIKAPDFPTGGIIYGYEGVAESYRTGRGRIVLRARTEIEQTPKGGERIIVTEIPYQVNKAELVTRIAEMVNNKRLEGISNIADESSGKGGMRIVIDIKRDANANVVLNHLYKNTALQSNFNTNNIALVDGKPELLNLFRLIELFVKHREDVVERRTRYDLQKAHEREHILQGLLIAVDNIDEVISIIRSSSNTQEAMERLQSRFNLTELQSRAIVDMRLRALTGLERDKLKSEYDDLEIRIAELELILNDHDELTRVVKDELLEVKAKYSDARRTEIVRYGDDFDPYDFYSDEEMIITISHAGYIKRTPLSKFRNQGRGGKGAKGSKTKESDFIEYIYSASMHATLLLFTEKGKCYWLRVFDIPEGDKTAQGRAIQNLINLESDDRITACIRIKKLHQDVDFVSSHYLLFATERGIVKKTILEDFSRPRSNGIKAINLAENDRVVTVRLTNGHCHILLANKNGRAVYFSEDQVRPMGRASQGVIGMRLDDDNDDCVVGMVVLREDSDEDLLVVSENGYGKRSLPDAYRLTKRGAKGVKTLQITDKTGKLVDFRAVNNEEDLMIIKRSGIAIRISLDTISVQGRATQGVKLVDLGDDAIASVCSVIKEEEEDDDDYNPEEDLGKTEEDGAIAPPMAPEQD